MLRKYISAVLCAIYLVTLIPVNALAADAYQDIHINNGMETTSGITGLSSGSASLTQDRVSGNYAIKVSVGDVPNQTSAAYTLATSSLFEVSKYSEIKLWVKPGPGAQWIQFLTNSVNIKNDKNGDGTFKVGEDLISGQWNEVTLDLTKTSSTITQAQSLTVSTNEYSTWTYDSIQTMFSSVSSLDIAKMVNSQTQLVNGSLRFKSNGTGGFNITPSTLVSQNNSSVPTTSFTRASVAYQDNTAQVGENIPRYKAGKFGNGVLIEPTTENLIRNSSFNNDSNADGLPDNYIKLGVGASELTATLGTDSSVNGKFVRLAYPGTIEAYIESSANLTNTFKLQPSTTYTLSFKSRKTSTKYTEAYIINCSGTGQLVQGYLNITPAGNFNRYSVTFTTSLDIPPNSNCSVRFDHNGGGGYVDIAEVQLETKTYSTSYVRNDSNTTSSTRNPETLFYNLTKQLTPEFFASGWFRFETNDSVPYGTLFQLGNGYDDAYSVLIKTGTEKKIYLAKGVSGVETNTASLNPITNWQKDEIYFIAIAQLTKTHGTLTPGMYLWYAKQGDATLQVYSLASTTLPSSITKVNVGNRVTGDLPSTVVHDALQLIDISSMEAAGTSFNSTFVNNQYTANSAPKLGAGHLLLSNYENSIESLGSFNNGTPTLPVGKISKISIDSTYAASAGTTTNLQPQKTYLSGVQPTVLAMSGDGSKVFYANPNDASKLYLLNLYNGENKKISDYVPIEIKVNFDGTRVAFKDINNKLYQTIVSFDATTGIVSTFSTSLITSFVIDFEIKNNGSICYHGSFNGSNTTNYPDGGLFSYYSSASNLDISKNGNEIYYTNSTKKLYKLSSTPAGWRSEELVSAVTDITGVWTNSDGSLVFYSTNSGIYCYQVSSKALRKLDIPVVVSYDYPNKQIVKVTDDNKLIIQLENYKYQVYDTDTDTSKDIRPSDAKTPPNAQTVYFATENSGNKIAYVANGGLATYYFNGVTRPERYLLSFDGKNSWQSYRDGTWTTVKTGSTPTTDDFSKYGMTIDEVNSLSGSDFEKLYENGRQLLHFDVAVYFASVDAFTTPSLSGIKVYFNTGDSQNGETQIEKSLYTTKQQDFTATKWRKIKKIYPVEIFPKDAEVYYFIIKDGQYKTYKNNQWSNVSSSLFSNVENSWIDSTNGQGITQLGMTAEELRAIPETSLQVLLPSTNISVVYAMKVQDTSTELYSSLITIDRVDNLFDAANLTLKIKFIDGTVQEYPNQTKASVEEFMEWVNGRQYNKGPIFYTIKTVSNGIEINDFINYYTIKSVSVDDTP